MSPQEEKRRLIRLLVSLNEEFQFAGKSVLDLGCGPGLYSQKMAQLGAKVTGIDFSNRSISFARKQSEAISLELHYIEGSYLDRDFSEVYDLIFLIYYDYCALSPDQRSNLLKSIYGAMGKQSNFILDVLSMESFKAKGEQSLFEKNLMGGFWAKNSYYGVQQTFLYPESHVVLDRYDIFEKNRERTIYNWLEYYDLEKIENELNEHGFTVDTLYSDLSGTEFSVSSEEFAVVARKA